jgi:NAD(P)-dependent dehydrogenase (short-subunit alcohol dehydrogenase family)
MVEISSFRSGANVAVIGASGGIGKSICRSLAASGAVKIVHALSRTKTLYDSHLVHPYEIDLLDEASIEDAAQRAYSAGELDLVIIATGILHCDDIQPEKKLRDINAANMLEVLQLNTVGPALVAKHFLPKMHRRHKTVFAALSARVGSIEDNRLGGWLSYRASKAALNMTMKTLAIEHARRCPDAIVVSLHPGTVATALSEPFRSRVPPAQLFDPDTSASYLLSVIDGLTHADTGGFFAWDGSRVQF